MYHGTALNPIQAYFCMPVRAVASVTIPCYIFKTCLDISNAAASVLFLDMQSMFSICMDIPEFCFDFARGKAYLPAYNGVSRHI